MGLALSPWSRQRRSAGGGEQHRRGTSVYVPGIQCCQAQIHSFACPGDKKEGLIHAMGKWVQLVTLSVYNLCLPPYHLKEGRTHIKSFFSYKDENCGGRAGGSGFLIDTHIPHNTSQSLL